MCSTLSEGLDVEVPSAAWAVTAQPDDFCFAAQVLEMGEEGQGNTMGGVQNLGWCEPEPPRLHVVAEAHPYRCYRVVQEPVKMA